MRRTRTVRVGELVDDLFRDPVIRRKIAEGRLPETWARVAGPIAAGCTTEVTFRGAILTVRLSSAVVRHEMFLRRAQLRDAINQASGHNLVRELIVR